MPVHTYAFANAGVHEGAQALLVRDLSAFFSYYSGTAEVLQLY